MVWDRIKRGFRRRGGGDTHAPEIPWIEADDSPWGVRVLDVRPVTLTMLASSRDPRMAANAVSFLQDDGTGFIGQEPPVERAVNACLHYPIDRVLADGALFLPSEMEHKWALFCHDREIICVRSWLRQVRVVARVAERGAHVEVTVVRGTFGEEDEEPGFTIRALDYLLRSHALGTVFPAPLPRGVAENPRTAAMWCMTMFGNRAWFATPDEVPWQAPQEPLRTHSLLHIAVARGDVAGIETRLAAGVPVDLLAADGLAPLHWALAQEDLSILGLLLERGSPVDVRTSRGATPLMLAAQDARLDAISFLLDRGADVDARDGRGFSALHHAAEKGTAEAARLLCDRGASLTLEAQGHTPRSLAVAQGRAELVAMLDGYERRV